jgi:DNA polymerase II large subunit
MEIKKYFERIQKEVESNFEIARAAKKKGFDPSLDVEIPIATSLAEKCTGLISTVYPQVGDRKIVSRILELEEKFGKLDPAVALTIAEEIAKEKYCKFKDLKEGMEAGIRLALSYLTLGVVSSPIEGFVELKFEKTKDGQQYLAPYFAGPIRSAGGTEAGFSLVIIDYLRETLGYAAFDPTEDEVKRGIHESYMYHERVSNLQYLPSEKEIEFLMKNLPIQVSGDPTEDKEVYNYKDLSRVPTNFIRGGFCLVLNEGIAQKAPKILKRIKKLQEKGFKLSNWNWMSEFVEIQHKIKENKSVGSSASATYIKDLVAGRPVFGHPSRSGSFRLRYGRCRNTGYSSLAVHPSTMRVSGDFIAIGTQLKIEKPTKGCTIASCSTIDAPIVKFKNGDVKQLWNSEEAKKRYNEIEEIIYFGDILVPYGDFMNRNHSLDKPGYVEQYWLQHLKKAGGNSELDICFEKAVELSKEFSIPLHPKFIFYWTQIDFNLFLSLLDWLAHDEIRSGKLILPYKQSDRERFSKGKKALELLGCEHTVYMENVIIDEKNTKFLLFNLGISSNESKIEASIDGIINLVKDLKNKSVLEIINSLSDIEIKDKAGTFIGSRMGRPEKAKLRKLIGNPHVLFPVGKQGGRLRSFQSALEEGFVESDFPSYYCDVCKSECVYSRCKICGKIGQRMCIDRVSGEKFLGESVSDTKREYGLQKIDIRNYFEDAKKVSKLSGDEVPVIVKGMRGISNKDHTCEHLAKGILRAKNNLCVNKDGTIRYDMTQMPITHFKPKEIGTSVLKLKELGYNLDIEGKELVNDNQILEIMPHDIILPSCDESSDENADDVLLRICKFIDDELEKIYGLPKMFNATNKDDLIGILGACMAPHICTAITSRVIGFSKTQALLASPYMHAAMRRDCDGDEAAFMLLIDILLNFSKKFLPAHRGGTQDAPLVLSTLIRAGEVDDMIFDVDTSSFIPLELYDSAELNKSPYDVKMEQVRNRLGKDNEFNGLMFSYDTDDINEGPRCSSYKTLPSMGEKVDAQMVLCEKIRAVDTSDVARLIIERHLIRDTRGNLRKFSMQGFRCVGCNAKFRRPPLSGKCEKCGGKLIFTIAEGSVLKYMQRALDLGRKYNVSPYLIESLELTEMYIQSIFGKDKEKQENLGKWF